MMGMAVPMQLMAQVFPYAFPTGDHLSDAGFSHYQILERQEWRQLGG